MPRVPEMSAFRITMGVIAAIVVVISLVIIFSALLTHL